MLGPLIGSARGRDVARVGVTCAQQRDAGGGERSKQQEECDLEAAGLGSYISHATSTGDFRRTVVGIVVMALFVVVINRVFWKPLFARAERKFRMS